MKQPKTQDETDQSEAGRVSGGALKQSGQKWSLRRKSCSGRYLKGDRSERFRAQQRQPCNENGWEGLIGLLQGSDQRLSNLPILSSPPHPTGAFFFQPAFWCQNTLPLKWKSIQSLLLCVPLILAGFFLFSASTSDDREVWMEQITSELTLLWESTSKPLSFWSFCEAFPPGGAPAPKSLP